MDAAGLALLGSLVVWTQVSAATSGGDPAPTVMLLLAAGGLVAAGWGVSTLDRRIVPALVVAAGLIVALASWSELFSRLPLSGPFGYANARGAFFVFPAIASLMLACLARHRVARAPFVLLAVAFALVPLRSGVVASAVVVFVLPGLGLLLVLVRGARNGSRTAIGVLGATWTLAVVASIAMAATYPSRISPLEQGASILTNERLALWHDAYQLMVDHPLSGVGPAQFQTTSPIALEDPADFRWAHHMFLQQGAEQGVVGLVLVLSVFVWGFARIAANPAPDAAAVLAAAALACVGILACVDYVLHFPAVPLIAAPVIGVGLSAASSRAGHRRPEGDR